MLGGLGDDQESFTRLRVVNAGFAKLTPGLVREHDPLPARVVTELARRLGMEVVATGLASDGQVALAADAGCRYGMGPALMGSLSAEEMGTYLLLDNRKR
jgi:EAL domain-containing protein (putative c-di-GMP-specific phosphodiesterase class I)